MDKSNLIEVRNLSKSFPGVQALKDVCFNVIPGEIRGLVGENGAGKSTLIKAIMGAHSIDKGSIMINYDGKEVTVNNPIEARRYGLYANYQSVNIAPELSVGENYFLGRLPKTKLGVINWKYVYEESKKILDRFKIKTDPKVKIRDLSLAQQAMVTISKMVTQELKLVIFDEPTALLENDKVEILFNFIRELKKQSIGIIYISHRLEEIMEICDTVTVLKDGELVDTLTIEDVDENKLVSLMVGRKLEDIYNIKHQQSGEVVLDVKDIGYKDRFEDVSFCLRRGEILGFFGLVGAGRTEVMRCIFGAETIDRGEISFKNKKVYNLNPNKAMELGIGFVPEDRRNQGLATPLSVKVNVNMNSYNLISKLGFINLNREKERCEYYKDKMKIKTPSIEQLVKNLSGGNQQKVVISKLLCRDLDIFIFDEPTVGVDVGAKLEIYNLIEQLTQGGKGVIIISSYLPEIMGLSDRIIVMAEGRVVGEVSRDECFREKGEEYLLRLASKFGA